MLKSVSGVTAIAGAERRLPMNYPTTAYEILADLEGKLEKCKHTGDKLRARCPAHRDKTPSLDVQIGDGGDRVVLICRAGCPTEDVVEALGWKMRDLFATDDAWRSHDASEIVHEADAAKQEDAPPLPSDVPGRVQAWIASLKAADLEGKRRILYLIKDAPEWQQLAADLRIVVVEAIKGTARSMATAILGRFDNVKLVWRNPPGNVEDTSEPDVVSLATFLADPLEPTDVVARGLAFGGCLGFIHGPKASGKTTILAAAAARVSQGQPWAGHDTEAGTVLVVTDDDPRSWTLALHDFGADTTRILMARARVVSRPGKLAALLAEHTPAWVIIDNLRTWCGSMNLDVDSSSSAALAIDPIAEAIRDCDHPVALTLLHNEARSKSEGVVVKGVPGGPYVNRLRNSTVFEDAADWIVGCAHVDGSTKTTIMAGEKTRRGIPTETITIDLSEDGYGTPTTGDDPFTPNAPTNQLDEKIDGYLMAHPEGSSQKSVAFAVGGRKQTVVARLKLLAVRDTKDKLYRHKGVPAEAVPIGGGENTGTGGCSGVFRPMGTGAEQGCSGVPTLIGNRGREQGSGTGVGNTDREHTPRDLALAVAKTATAPTPMGGSVAVDRPIDPSSIPAPPGGEPAAQGKNHDAAQRRLREEEPKTHTSGIMKWDDATGTWVDTLPDDCWLPFLRKVSLSDGLTVTDGDPSIHKPSCWTEDQWYAWEHVGMVH